MLDVEEALRLVESRSHLLPPCVLPLAEALGHVLAEDVAADLDLPPFDKALVDGYAVRSSDLAEGTRWLRLGEEIPAGRMPRRPLQPGEAAAVMTGAPLPEGADAVVMIERTRRDGDSVEFGDAKVSVGLNRLSRGREMRAGDVVATTGSILNSARLGVLASVGKTAVSVVPGAHVSIVSTGDELVDPDQVPGPGQIRNSNSSTLLGLVHSTGATGRIRPKAADRADELRAILGQGLGDDVLLISGGVSAGTYDLVPGVLEGLGVIRVFHKVRLKPGKPLWFGVGPARPGGRPGTLVFGLPGNPVSGIVCFLLFVRPALGRLAGRTFAPATTPARLANPFEHAGDRPTFHPARIRQTGQLPEAETLEWAGSNDLRTVASADGFVHFPAGDRTHDVGEIVQFLPLG